MNFDYSSVLGGGLLLGVLIWVLITVVTLLVLYAIIRGAVRGGLRVHQLWLERNRPALPPAPPRGAETDH